jgi:transposase
VPEVVVPDNTRTGVTHASYYEPDLNPTYHELAMHYGTVIIPARPYKPRDRAKAESAVLMSERWILAPLRDRPFGSLAELNAAIAEQRKQLNDRPFQKLPGSRRTLFEALDRPALRPLPTQRYEFAHWKQARANVDYHVALLHNDYSVPYELVHRELDCRVTATTGEIFAHGQRVASHVRAAGLGHYVTDPRHRPVAHQRHLEWTPSRLIRWAETGGPQTAALVEAILQHKPHPEQGYRACLGLRRLGKQYSPARLEAAATRALACGALSYRSVRSILDHRLDEQPLQEPLDLPLPAHPNVRGAAYYRDPEETPSC